ncbi:uncharacterized protein A1O5_12568 [Cladophialophora psammophila CBS 110553]|uniref:Uncharacterized protein n=1 Tax=Cladophialophora psammophila CBS 110553 TaxID=1182543 RepID=W9VVP7_9EURO|nr:uncharacterized protein A1O5_12568 [Cladophialophora psammophila CBS 110553]EXJ56301.1 hypothetical protein A1O5_12568 [Cladophialophora psammophila CBS 110553]
MTSPARPLVIGDSPRSPDRSLSLGLSGPQLSPPRPSSPRSFQCHSPPYDTRQTRSTSQREKLINEPKAPCGGVKPSPPIRSCVDLSLNGYNESAVADTGAQENFISARLATRLKLHIWKQANAPGSIPPQFINAVGQSMKVLGHVTVSCKFTHEAGETSENRFWVLPGLIVPLIVGRKFLEVTECLTKFRYRLRKATSSQQLSLRALHMELRRQRLNCRIGDQLVQTVPDTGSDLDLMSLTYAKQSGFHIQKLDPDPQLVQFGDGSTKQLSGKVLAKFSIGTQTGMHEPHEFYVLDGLTSDVLLGGNTLDEFDVFNRHKNNLFELPDLDQFCDFNYVRWVQKNGDGSFLEASFDDFEFKFFPPPPGDPPDPPPGDQAALSVFQRLKRMYRRQSQREQRTCLSLAESETRYRQYLRYQSDKELERRRRATEEIARLSQDRQITAQEEENAAQHQHDQQRQAFVARYHAAVTSVQSSSIPQSTSMSRP